ncbi:MAG: hypothetical protein KBB64_10740 [Bacteroidia bacterium]|jgi:uncharacterized protein YjhX (UPF0386 family)|nr:hypothetical protein [Bacteroidia bacterium]
MFEYSKEILTKVSFDKSLFTKELTKAITWLKKDERKMLMVWCLTTFGHKYSDVIVQAFRHYVR